MVPLGLFISLSLFAEILILSAHAKRGGGFRKGKRRKGLGHENQNTERSKVRERERERREGKARRRLVERAGSGHRAGCADRRR